MSLLNVSNIQAAYGAIQVLFDVSLSVEPGEVLALMGRNGMGKSTTIKSVCRLLPVSAGTLTFDSYDLLPLPTHRAVQLGIGLVPEGRRCFRNLSVRENLVVAARPGYWDLQKLGSLFPRLAERKSQSAAHLSGGEQQMLAIARALMTNPRLLILDEATEGLAPIVRQEIWHALASLKQQRALAIIVVDKSIKELSQIADHAVILERGSTVWTGPMGELTEEISNRFLGV